ncbi:MAG: hypothetical protein ABJF11_01120 [Reichenbachiella sp.]|uniref:hypothetical protein n=1 Tax=Reichenbachiella sp. TaxID=2184521 RepID=UPI0032647656
MRIILSMILLMGYLNGQSQDYKISMSEVRQPITFKSYNIINVIDGRKDKTTIGFVQKGMANKKVNAVFSNGLNTEVYSYVKRSLPLNLEIKPIVVRVNYLKISELTRASSERAFVKLGIDFLIKQDTTYLLLLNSKSSIESKGLDVTKQHPENIALAIKKCFEKLDKIDLDSLDLDMLSAVLADDSVSAEQKFDLSQYSGLQQRPKKGVYKTFEEFLSNQPLETDFDLEVEPRTTKGWEGTFSSILRYPGSKRKMKNVWGFSDGISRHIFHQGDYFKIEITDDGVHFVGYDEMDFSSTSMAGFMGGAIGAGIASAAVVSTAKKNKVTYKINLEEAGTIEPQDSE